MAAGKELPGLENLATVRTTVDLCFLLDVTGSMGDSIAAAKERVLALAAGVRVRFAAATFRFAFVGYRDVGDRDDQFVVLDFTPEMDALRAVLDRTAAKGGNDIPENVQGALVKVVELGWSGRVKVLVHIADAPAHSTELHDLERHRDDFPDGVPGTPHFTKLMKDLVDLHVDYYFGAIRRASVAAAQWPDKTAAKFKEAYDARPNKRVPMTITTLEAIDPAIFEDLVIRSVTNSVRMSVRSSLGGGATAAAAARRDVAVDSSTGLRVVVGTYRAGSASPSTGAAALTPSAGAAGTPSPSASVSGGGGAGGGGGGSPSSTAGVQVPVLRADSQASAPVVSPTSPAALALRARLMERLASTAAPPSGTNTDATPVTDPDAGEPSATASEAAPAAGLAPFVSINPVPLEPPRPIVREPEHEPSEDPGLLSVRMALGAAPTIERSTPGATATSIPPAVVEEEENEEDDPT